MNAPGIVDVLTDVVENGLNSEALDLCWGHQEAVREQRIFLQSADCG